MLGSRLLQLPFAALALSRVALADVCSFSFPSDGSSTPTYHRGDILNVKYESDDWDNPYLGVWCNDVEGLVGGPLEADGEDATTTVKLDFSYNGNDVCWFTLDRSQEAVEGEEDDDDYCTSGSFFYVDQERQGGPQTFSGNAASLRVGAAGVIAVAAAMMLVF